MKIISFSKVQHACVAFVISAISSIAVFAQSDVGTITGS